MSTDEFWRYFYEIYEAILSGDGNRVDRAVQSHLELAKKDISRLMRRTREDAFLQQSG